MNKRLNGIKNPKFTGCLNCSETPNRVLDKDRIICSYYPHDWYLNGDRVESDIIVSNIKANDGDLLFFETPLRDETYQLQDDDWILVKQGIGYA